MDAFLGRQRPDVDGGNFHPRVTGQRLVRAVGPKGDPYKLVTMYDVSLGVAAARVTQTTTYVNGESNFVNSYAVKNRLLTDSSSVRSSAPTSI